MTTNAPGCPPRPSAPRRLVHAIGVAVVLLHLPLFTRDLRAQGATPEPAPPVSSSRQAPVAEGRQATTSFPGHISNVAAYSSPVERKNLLGAFSIEQGFRAWHTGRHAVVPYGAVRVSIDERGFDWNNKAVAHVGMKYVLSFARGLVQAGGGYAHERRTSSDYRAGQPFAIANYWFGWGAVRPDAPSTPRLFSLPGSSWGEIGNHAPAEGHNVLMLVYLEQGLTAARVGPAAIIPFAELTLSADSAQRGWNNVRMFGQGLKVTMPLGGTLVEAAAIYRQEHRWREGRSGDGLAGFAHFRYSWNLRGGR